jgi:hypothetical protein
MQLTSLNGSIAQSMLVNNPPTSVPEPATVVAGMLLLLPFGISTARILLKNKITAAE